MNDQSLSQRQAKYYVKIADADYSEVSVVPTSERRVAVTFNGTTYNVDMTQYQLESPVMHVKIAEAGKPAEEVIVQLFKKTSLGYQFQFVGTLVRLSYICA